MIKKLILTISALLLFVGATKAAVLVVPAGGDLQAAINSAQLGDTIIVQAGGFYTGNYTLPLKSGSDYITIQSSRASELPEGVRVGPAQSPLLAKLQSNLNGEPVIKTVAGAHHYKFVGVEVSTVSVNIAIFDLVRLGDGRQVQKTLESVPHDLIIDRSWIRGFSTQDVQRGVSWQCASCDVTNSYISDIHGVGFDTQAIAGWNGTSGKIINNYLEAAGENILLGGADPAMESMIPANIEIRRNTIFKPLSWKVGDPTYAGKHWTVKNSVELKLGKNVIIDGNIIENNWTDGQTGIPVLFTVRNQDGTAPYSIITNVTFTNNTVKNAEGGINLLGSDNEKPSQRCSGLIVRNNVFDQIKGHFLTMSGYNNVTLERNTHLQTANTMTLYGTESQGFAYRDNLTIERAYGVFGDGGLIGKSALDRWTPAADFTGNVMAHPPLANSWYSPMPAGNEFPASINLSADYRSDRAGKGADIDQLLAAQKGSAVSIPSPSPSVSPSPTATPTPLPSPSPSPTATPTPNPSPSPSPSPTPARPVYEVLELSFSGESQLRTRIKECAAQGYSSYTVGTSGRVLYCSRVKQ
jgi:hypothetical protein